MKMDMSKEKSKQQTIPVGIYDCKIVNAEERTSKAGNQMFVFTLALIEDMNLQIDVFAIATAGKRWFLKTLLEACNIPAAADGVYDWEIKDVIAKTVKAEIVHEENEWINREGNKQKILRAKVSKIFKTDVPF